MFSYRSFSGFDRDRRSLFAVLHKVCLGKILDVAGERFFGTGGNGVLRDFRIGFSSFSAINIFKKDYRFLGCFLDFSF